jgi:imidazolonepropionase-like amidohydrolase
MNFSIFRLVRRHFSGWNRSWWAALALWGSASLHAEPPGVFAIQNAHIVTVSGADIPKGSVLVRDGIIEDVGSTVTVPAGAWVIDGSGLTVYPGFIDGLSTWGIPPASPATAQTAPKPVHGPEDRPQTYAFQRAADLVSPTDRRLEAARAAGFTSAATFPNRGIVEGLGALVNLAGERPGDMVVAQPIGQQIVMRTGAGGLGRSFPSSLMGNISYVRQLYLDLDQYKTAKQLYAQHVAGVRRPDYDHDLEGLAESPRLLLPADEEQQIRRMIHLGQELKTPFVLYGMHESFKCIDQLKSANVPVLISLKWPEKPRDADPTVVPNYRDLEMRAQAPATPAALVKAGVPFAFFSDGIENAADIKKAVKKSIDSGLPRAEAVKALTLSAAQMYGVADRTGSLDKGKIANLVVTRGEAFDDKTTVEYVFIDGKEFRPSKDQQQTTPASGPGGRRPTPSTDFSGVAQ